MPALLCVLTTGLVSCGKENVDISSDDEDNDRTFVIPFAPVFGSDTVRCGETYTSAGTSGTEFEIKDFLLFVHSVELVRESGETVPLTLTEDQHWQGGGVALLDFNDATGSCVGDSETNGRIVGTAPNFDDYTGIRFGVGVPSEKNHINAVTAEAPLNKPSTWWSWKGGYKFFKLNVITPVHKKYVVHIGSTGCTGSVEEGFSCAGEHEVMIDIDGFAPGEDGIKINLANLFAGVDLDAPVDFESGDFIPGCMSFDPDPECEPLYSKFGRHFLDDGAASPQRVFEVDLEAAPSETPEIVDSTPQPGNKDFKRDSALDSENVSAAGVSASHGAESTLQVGDRTYARGPGSQCMSCHQPKGPGRGLFEVAGTIWSADGKTPQSNAIVKILPISAGPCAEDDPRDHCQGQDSGYFLEEDVVATLETDPNGNFYSTELSTAAAPPFWPVVVGATGAELPTKFMGHPAASGSCNMCHGSFRVKLGEP